MPLEPGEAGSEAPAAVDVRIPSRPTHNDSTGRAGAGILALAGSEEGFAAVWADGRDGAPRLFLGRYDTEGLLLEPERPVAGPGSDLEAQPSVALGPRGEGAIAWYSSREGVEYVSLRSFDGEGAFLSGEQPLAKRLLGGSAVDGPAAEPPSLVLDDEGRAFVLWRAGPILTLAVAGRNGRLSAPGAALTTLRQPAVGPAHIAAGSGRFVAAWPGSRGTALWVQRDLGVPQRVELPRVGRPLGLEFDRPSPSEPATGLWLLSEDGERRQLWHLDLSLAIDREPLIVDEGPERRAVLSSWTLGPIVLLDGVEADPAEQARAAELGYAFTRAEFFRADGKRVRPTLEFGELRTSREPVHIAALGDRLWFAWDVREVGSTRIATWLLHPRRDQQPPANLIDDAGNGHQRHAHVASDEEATRALAVWSDGREPVPGIYVRRIDPTDATLDGFPTRERRVDFPRHNGASWPAVAVDSDGRFLIAWKEERDDGTALVGRLFEATGRAATAPVYLDPGKTTVASSAPALVALRGGRGFAVVWDRTGEGAWIRHLTQAGSLGAYAARLSEADVIERPALCLLDDGHAVAAWGQSGVARAARCAREDARLRLAGRRSAGAVRHNAARA